MLWHVLIPVYRRDGQSNAWGVPHKWRIVSYRLRKRDGLPRARYFFTKRKQAEECLEFLENPMGVIK